MKLKSIYARGYRSLERVDLTSCGGLNVLIGKNNSGKSNILSSIMLVQGHLRHGTIAAPWPTQWPRNEFTHRDVSRPIEVGVELELTEGLNEGLRAQLAKEAPHLEKSIQQISAHRTVALIISGQYGPVTPFLFVRQLAAGSIDADGDSLSTSGIRLLDVPHDAARELFDLQQRASTLASDLTALRNIENRDFEHLFDRWRAIAEHVGGEFVDLGVVELDRLERVLGEDQAIDAFDFRHADPIAFFEGLRVWVRLGEVLAIGVEEFFHFRVLA